jgi:hypothetical protein
MMSTEVRVRAHLLRSSRAYRCFPLKPIVPGATLLPQTVGAFNRKRRAGQRLDDF